MVVIYSQDKTYMENDIESAKKIMTQVYGEKLGNEAYAKLAHAPIGTSFRKNGGPLIKLVNDSEARTIRKKEKEIGMM